MKFAGLLQYYEVLHELVFIQNVFDRKYLVDTAWVFKNKKSASQIY